MAKQRPRVCEYCGKQSPAKLTSSYARWYPFGQDSVGYALSLCDSCVEKYLIPAIAASWDASFDEDLCPMCHDPWDNNWSYTWLVSYARREEPARFTVGVCELCANAFRARFIAHGRRLEDRPRAENDVGQTYWVQLGIEHQRAS